MDLSNEILRALQPYKVKKMGSEYRCNSPFRAGSDSQSFAVNFETGEYYDHVDQVGGKLISLARKLGIVVPTTEVESSKRSYTGLADYAKAHGIPPEVLPQVGWKEVTYQNRPALEFKTQTGRRWRFLDGNQPHYKSENGYRRCWYHALDSKTLSRMIAGKPLVICNGEISTIVGRYYDLAAASITGGEKGEIPPDLMDQLVDFMGDANIDPDLPPLIIIALDCDAAGRKAAKAMEGQLRAAGYHAFAVDMGLGKGGDLADFCMLHGDQSLTALSTLPHLPDLAVSNPLPERNWVIVHASELENLPPVEWLIPGEIPKKGLCVIFGQSGAGKSFLSLDYALRLAQAGSVVYIAAEGESGYPQRIAAWRTHNKQGVGNLYICLGAVNIYDPDDFEDFVTSITQYNPCLVVVDTLAMCMSGDENDAKAMGSVIRASKRMMNELSCSVVMVHHVNKGGIAERGSTALRGACDMMIKVSPEDDIIRVECSKTKDTAAFQPRYMKLLPIILGTDADGREIASPVIIPAEKIIQTKDDLLSPQQQKALLLLIMPDQMYGATVADVASLTEMLQPSARRTLATLLRLQFVTRTESGKYQITESGKKALLKSDHDPAIRAIIENSQTKFSSQEEPADRADRSDRLIADRTSPMFEGGNNHQYNTGH